MTYQEWLTQAVKALIGSESPKRDAEILLGFVTGKSRTFLVAFNETTLSMEEAQRLEALLARRIAGEPIAYIIGEKEFWSLPFAVSPTTLIPRPDTEILVELALERLPAKKGRILDLGSGTGAIAIALAKECPNCAVTGVDIQPEAVKLAQYNAERLAIKNVTFLAGSWFEPVKTQQFAMIASNPPYIDPQDPHLKRGDVRFEPLSALVSDDNGLADIKQIVENAKSHLQQYGWLLIEHGWQQGKNVRRIFKQHGFELVETHADYGGNERVTLGRWFTP